MDGYVDHADVDAHEFVVVDFVIHAFCHDVRKISGRPHDGRFHPVCSASAQC